MVRKKKNLQRRLLSARPRYRFGLIPIYNFIALCKLAQKVETKIALSFEGQNIIIKSVTVR